MNNKTFTLTLDEITEIVNQVVTTKKLNPEIIDENELSKRLNISKVTLHKYRKNGTIPFSTVGRNIRYDYQKVLKLMENKK
jgi:excisionase family DNA binding protein